jgi:hypothetical protein
MHMGAGNNDDDDDDEDEFEYVYYFLSNYRFRLQGTFHLERYITSITRCILLMYAQWCFLEKVNLHFTG